MSRHRYRVYYEFNGRTKGDPFRTEKTTEQIADVLGRVEFELSVILDDEAAQISTSAESAKSVVLSLETTKPDETVLLALKSCLNGLDLFATKLE
jgi:hypothetical protein